MGMSDADPILEACYKSFPEHPDIDVAETPYTREQLGRRIDYWMEELSALTEWEKSLG